MDMVFVGPTNRPEWSRGITLAQHRNKKKQYTEILYIHGLLAQFIPIENTLYFEWCTLDTTPLSALKPIDEGRSPSLRRDLQCQHSGVNYRRIID